MAFPLLQVLSESQGRSNSPGRFGTYVQEHDNIALKLRLSLENVGKVIVLCMYGQYTRVCYASAVIFDVCTSTVYTVRPNCCCSHVLSSY